MPRNPTDRELLKCIYDTYYDNYVSFGMKQDNRVTKAYVPLDLDRIARLLSVDSELVFGRLYYHLQQRYGAPSGNKDIQFFLLQIGHDGKTDRHVINFALLDSALASMEYEHDKFLRAWRLSLASVLIAASALAITIATNFGVLTKLIDN